jgi:hypothetical protein
MRLLVNWHIDIQSREIIPKRIIRIKLLQRAGVVYKAADKVSSQSKILSGRLRGRYLVAKIHVSSNQLCIHTISVSFSSLQTQERCTLSVTNVILQINMFANCSKVLSKEIQQNRIHFVCRTLATRISQLDRSDLSQFLSSSLPPSLAWYFASAIAPTNQNQTGQANKTSESEISNFDI